MMGVPLSRPMRFAGTLHYEPARPLAETSTSGSGNCAQIHTLVVSAYRKISFRRCVVLGYTSRPHTAVLADRGRLSQWESVREHFAEALDHYHTKGCAMPSTASVDVAIGIAFVYLFLSLICTVVNEGIASIFSLRAKNLVRGINSLFSDSKIADGRHFVDAIYAHGLVRGLFPDPSPAELQKAASLVAGSSADQPPAPHSPAQEPRADHAAAGLPFVVALIEKKMKVSLPSYIPSRTFATALTDVIAPPDPNDPKPRSLEEVRQAIAKLPDRPTQQALLSAVADTQKDVAEFQQKVENWFNDSMDRAAGWYKRRAQTILLGTALVVTLVMNVDTIKLAQSLWSDPVARQGMVDLAQTYVTEHKNQNPAEPKQGVQQGTTVPAAGTGTEAPSQTPAPQQTVSTQD